MKTRSIILATVLATGLATPAMAEQRYLAFFKYSDNAVKAMTENPQDRSAQIAKLAESFGGYLEAAYWFPAGSEYDGMRNSDVSKHLAPPYPVCIQSHRGFTALAS